ncbi:MAG: MerR family transcriptional regulator [Clostridiaceae bacterium]|nr:MerR family transcriptional regulator [Clostridiaceae bacterium]
MLKTNNLNVKKMTIGQMANLNHVSEQTLRLYDREGLLSPLYRDEKTGYRYYDIRQSAQLDTIQYMKALGMSLKEIKIHMKDWDMGRIKQLLRQNRDAIDEKVRELNLQKRAIERALDSYERYESAPPDGAIVMEYIPKRQMYVTNTKINFYDYDIAEYEKVLRILKEDMADHKISPFYFANAGTILRKDRFLKRNLYSTEVFVFVDREYVADELITWIPASTYLCIYCDRFEKEKEYIDRLLAEIEARNYIVTGDYICEVIVEMPLDYAERGMFLRLQIPVRLN